MNDRNLQKEFENGTFPYDLDGFYKGELAALFPSQFTEIIGAIISKFWMPWKGKFFYSSVQSGDNIFSPKLAFLLRYLYFDLSRTSSSDGLFHAFPFATSAMNGIFDPIPVVQLNYNLPQNSAIVKGVIDEIVCTGPEKYLGKAYIRSGNGYRLVAYFRLKK